MKTETTKIKLKQIAFDLTGKMWAISENGDLYSVDRLTGRWQIMKSPEIITQSE
jgi:hypothetical protein